MTATISFNLPELTDNSVAFANAAAWNSYFSNITAEVEFDAIENTTYYPVAYNTGLVPAAFNIGDVDYIVPTSAMFTSLLNAYNALNTNYQLLRTELRAAGLITNAQ